MPDFTDQLGRIISLDHAPQRIISLVPSQTEMLYNFGLESEVVGITKFCVRPEQWFHAKTKVGGTKHLNPGAIEQLDPDLILASKEENTRDQIEELAVHFPVWVSDVKSLTEALAMIDAIGNICQKQPIAKEMISGIAKNFEHLKPKYEKIKTAYFIWQNPYMAAGANSFINDMMNRCGFENIFAGDCRYPQTTVQELLEKDCKLLLLSSEPFPFNERHVGTLQDKLPGVKIILVDGEMFSWYGSRLLHAPSYFNKLLAEI